VSQTTTRTEATVPKAELVEALFERLDAELDRTGEAGSVS
jgi:hypothetical protein